MCQSNRPQGGRRAISSIGPPSLPLRSQDSECGPRVRGSEAGQPDCRTRKVLHYLLPFLPYAKDPLQLSLAFLFLKKNIFKCVCVSSVWGCPQRPEESTRCPRARVRSSYELPDVGIENQISGPPEKQQILSTSEPSLQTPRVPNFSKKLQVPGFLWSS